MKFGRNLRRSIYPPWKDKYLEYDKLKSLLREDVEDDDRPWTENDEAAFVEELINVQLEKVNAFQTETIKTLRERMSDCESQLEQFALRTTEAPSQHPTEASFGDEAILKDVLAKLDDISKEVSELEKYCRINFTGAIKAAKKHDRRRGTNYRIRPILQVRLASLPFNSEDYSPLLYRLSAMYTFVRQRLDGVDKRASSVSETRLAHDRYTSYKFFIHPDNLLEVKTYILRHLPVLIYSPSNTKIVRGAHEDPTITSLYFDDPDFQLYNNKISKDQGASSLRIRWFGQLADKPELILEKKTMGEGDDSEEIRIPIKQKYVMPFIQGKYHMEKSVQKLRERNGGEDDAASHFESNAENIQNYIREHGLQPVVRANYPRMAFQIPGEDRVRISIDTNLVMIREDAMDTDRPCRDPESWHRLDIDNARQSFPFQNLRKGEITRFPYSVLEIKVRDGPRKKPIGWVEEFMSSHLLKEAPRFSKFVHGVASLFEDYVNIFPFWMSLMETDIRKDPDEAFREEQERRARQAENEFAVGSFLGGSAAKSSLRPAASSPIGKTTASGSRVVSDSLARSPQPGRRIADDVTAGEVESDEEELGVQADPEGDNGPSGLRAYLPTLSTSKYARAKREQTQLPPGVSKPKSWIKDAGTVKVEPKVWLANQRTFVKWEHIAVLLATFALTLYNAASSSNGRADGKPNNIARTLGIVYTLIAAFTAAWGWWTFQRRSRMIEKRSGKDFDMILGPLVVCTSLLVALCINFSYQYSQHRELSAGRGFPGNELHAEL